MHKNGRQNLVKNCFFFVNLKTFHFQESAYSRNLVISKGLQQLQPGYKFDEMLYSDKIRVKSYIHFPLSSEVS